MKTLNEQLNKMKYLSNYKKGSPLNEQSQDMMRGMSKEELNKLKSEFGRAKKSLEDAWREGEVRNKENIKAMMGKVKEIEKLTKTDDSQKLNNLLKNTDFKNALNDINNMYNESVNEQDEDKSEEVLSNLDKILNTLKNSTVQKESFVIKRNGKTIRLSESDMKKITKKLFK